MSYRIRESGEVVSQDELRNRNPEISLPVILDPDTLEFLSVDVVFETPAPTVTELEVAYKDGVELDSKGNWVYKWSIRPMFTDIKDENGAIIKSKEQQETEFLAVKRQQLQTAIVSTVQNRLDTFAQARGYDNILSACTYANSSVTKFKNEADYCIAQRDATWTTLYSILADVEAGIRTVTSFADIEAELPILIW